MPETKKTDDTKKSDEKPPTKGTALPQPDSAERVADNKTLTASVSGMEGKDPQPPRDMPLSEATEFQQPGGVGFATRQVPEGHSDLSAKEKLKLYIDTFVASSPDDRIVFGSVNVAITMGDLRELAGD